jgi:hypothetical protein
VFFLTGAGRLAGQRKVVEVFPFFPIDPGEGVHYREDRYHGH